MREEHGDEAEFFTRVDELLADLSAQRIPLLPPGERTRLRKASGLSAAQVADVLGCEAEDVEKWEVGTQEPLAARRAGYARLLQGLKALEAPQTDTSAAPPKPAAPPTAADQHEKPALFPTSGSRLSSPTRRTAPTTPRKPQSVTPTGPLAVVDHTGTLIAHFTNGSQLVLDAVDLVGLLEWALRSGLRQEKLSPYDQDGDPLLVLTPKASAALHLPAELGDRATLRLPDHHPVLAQLDQAGFRLTHRGFGPWRRAFRPVVNNKRASVQLAVMAWGAVPGRLEPARAAAE